MVEKMNHFYTYVYIDPSRDNEPIYIGKGFASRMHIHMKRTDRHPLTRRLQKMARNNIEPIIGCLCKDIDEELALLCEEEAIDLYGRKDLGKGTLLNLTDGGEGASGLVMSEEAKRKLSEHFSGKTRPEEHRAKMRKPKSEEHRRKVRAANIGKKQSPETIEKKRQSFLRRKCK
jgi:NUMOD3 motif